MASLVQSAGNFVNSATSLGVTLTGTTAANTILVAIVGPAARTITCSDGNGPYTIDSFNSPRVATAIARASGIPGGTITVTGAISGAAGTIVVIAEEWNGIQTALPLDQQFPTNGGAVSATSATIGPTGTLASSSEVAFSVCGIAVNEAGLVVTPGGPPSWTADTHSPQGSAFFGGACGWLLTTATTAQSVTYTWTNSGQWAGCIATYKIGSSFIQGNATRQIVPGFRMLRAGGYYSD